MSGEQEKNQRLLQDLLKRAGNGTCADCGFADPDWASLTLGVFVCQSCSAFHKASPNISRVKSLLLEPWQASEVEFMASTGNDAAKAKYEQKVPPFYYRPTHTDSQVLREQWFHARYERNEFMYIEKQEPYSAGYREGFLWKRGRDNGQFLSRKFILSEREGILKYFNKHDAREPKASMRIETLNATFRPAKIGSPHGLQITYLKDNSTRNIFVYHEDGKEMVDWFNAIRAARFHYLQVAFPGAGDADLVPKLTRNFIKEGFMEKTGPKQTEGFKKRWFTMDDRRLMYFKDPLDAYARGEVFIGSKENSYAVQAGLPPSTQGHRWQHGITIITPDRKFLFACETEAEQKDWIAAFQRVINRPMLPQEYAVEAHFKHKP
ncbi:arf-GAP with dual PH domain-containing protein 1 [Paramormyrops kingsleyae]|uniref:ArfGAP with dual PH domains 1 n=1 Tax=Paramormyrops kingsleyae TaxID=1676925 RepID=A0A3B3QWK4_9TELE|nr:arf-GAP with dual PH domain-containing protein 1 [Paramormyrops kingsleyae]XP_023700204.1 arf-GAP with dual PH domain-containing protein 1 [Paramormyrops kingsleyae]